MKQLKELDSESILQDEIFDEVFSFEDEIKKARLIIELSDRAKELGVKSKFDEIMRAYKKVERQTRKLNQTNIQTLENWTNFESDGKYDNMACGNWIATEEGIFSQNYGTTDAIACYHPILPIERMKNLETGEEQIKIAYKRNGVWNEITIPKIMITSASKIVGLSANGIAVTSENAKLLVRYLADVENANNDYINVTYSSSKLGWNDSYFLPYDKDIYFDGDYRFRQLCRSIEEKGSKDKWYKHVKELRATNKMEIKIILAASFASVLVKNVGGLPFIVDLWGETGSGKTVTLMLAASIWANPTLGMYIGDFESTDVGFEAKADMLNNLPMILDDTNKMRAKKKEDIEGLIYILCSGKGRTRSNKELGINKENYWKNCILTTGEKPITSHANQGGAINRVLEIESVDDIYKNPKKTAEFLKKNYGFAGKDYIKVIKEIGFEKVLEIQSEFYDTLQSDEKTQKQSISLSIILTADKIATDYLFQDGHYIDINEAKKILVDKNEVSDNERCYAELVDKIAMNQHKFDDETVCEKWGVIDGDYAVFFGRALEELLKQDGYSKKSFLSWAKKKGLLATDKDGRLTKNKKIDGRTYRCIWIKIDNVSSTPDSKIDDGFEPLPDEIKYELPFD